MIHLFENILLELFINSPNRHVDIRYTTYTESLNLYNIYPFCYFQWSHIRIYGIVQVLQS